MSSEVAVVRTVFIYALLLPLAVFMGYLLATPLDVMSMGTVAMVLMALVLPLMLKWHHQLLILSWNAALIVFFLPGSPSLGVVVAFISLFLSLVRRTMSKEGRFIPAPSITWPLLFFSLVMVITAYFRGGIGGRAFGSENWGGMRYIAVFGGIVGFFALIAQPIPRERAMLYAILFFLSTATAGLGDLAYFLGPSAYFMFALIPSDTASLQAMTQATLNRLRGLSTTAEAAVFVMLLRYELGSLLSMRRLVQGGALLLFVALCMVGGYRSAIILILLIIAALFLVEKLYRTAVMFWVILFSILAGLFLMTAAEKLPLSMQRSLSFLPIEINPIAQKDAQGTLEWRFEMWKVVLPEVPKYFFLGKGFLFNETDFYLTGEAWRRGIFHNYEQVVVTGDYHNGPLTIIITFGIFGVLGFAWFCVAALRALRLNFRNGHPELMVINRFLYGYFIARLVMFAVFYGSLTTDLMLLTGIVGLSISINGGICQSAPVSQPVPAPLPVGVHPALALTQPARPRLVPNT